MTTVFTRSVPPQVDPIAESDGRVRNSWLAWFSQRQTLDNSLQHRWIARAVAGMYAAFPNVIVLSGGSEFDPLMFPVGAPIMVQSDGEYLRGIVNSCTFAAGPVTTTFDVTMDKGATLGTLTGLFYGALTSSVLP